MKMRDGFIERRRYVRLRYPVTISYAIPATGTVLSTATKNISADGLRFETREKDLKQSEIIELTMTIPSAPNPVHAKGKVVWKKKMSLEDAAPFDCGVEFTEIEEDNKNTFLKFLCDLIYTIDDEPRHAGKIS